MIQDNSSPLVTWCVRGAGAVAVLIGGFWLAAWFTGGAAQELAAGEIIPKTNTSLCLLLAGMALLLLSDSAPTGIRRMMGAALAMIVLFIGALTLSEHLFGWDFGIDQFLLTEAPGARSTVSHNRMGPPASLSMALLGAGLLALVWDRRRIVPYLGLAVCLINLLPAVGFIYGIQSFYDLPQLTFIAWPTVLALFLLGAGLVMTERMTGPMAQLMLNDPGGALLRRMLPVVILIPLMLGYIQTQGHIMDLYDIATGTGYLMIILILAFLLILWRSANQLSRIASAETEAYKSVGESEARLNQAQQIANIGSWEWDIETGGVHWSDQVFRQMGEKPGKFASSHDAFLRHIHPHDQRMVEAAIAEALADVSPFDLEFRILRPDGIERVLHSHGEVMSGPDECPRRMVGVCMDITDRKRAQEAVTQSQKTFLELVERSPFGTYIVDSRFCIAMMNVSSQTGAFANVRPVIGHAFEEAMRILWPEPVAADIIGHFRHTLDTGEPYYSRDFMNPRHDVDTVEGYEWELHRMTLPDGQYGVICYYYDSTKLRQAEAAVRESEERERQRASELQAVLETAPIAMWIAHDPECRRITGNAAADSLLQAPRSANISASAPPGEATVTYKVFRGDVELHPGQMPAQFAVATGRPVMGEELELVFADGRRIHLIESVIPLFHADGRVRGAIIAGQDITARKQAEEAVRQSEERLRLLGDNLPDSAVYQYVHELDGSVRFLYFSAGVERLNGVTVADVLRDAGTLHRQSPPEYIERLVEAEARSERELSDFDMELPMRRPDGQLRWMRLHSRPRRLPNGRTIWDGVQIDVTNLKRAEEELRKSRDELEIRVAERTAELAAINRALTEYALKLDKLNKELQEFAFVASHDLQEPLRKIQTFCDMAKQRCASALDATGQDYLDRAAKSATRMRQLLEGLLQYSRVTTKGEVFKEVDLGKMVHEAADLFDEKLQESGGKVEIQRLPCIDADESQMLQLFQNLIGNAVKYCSDKHPQIKIHSTQGEKACEIFVEDNGIGFDPAHAEKIFMPFQRLHGRNEYEGTGMGLAICRKIAERHGGSIRAKSNPGKGATFVIRLPLKQNKQGDI